MPRISNRMRLFSVVGVVVLLQFSSVQGAEPDKDDDADARRLEFMLRPVRRYEVVPDDNQGARWSLHEKPLLRWSNPFSGVRDGIVVMWTDGARPAVLAQIFPAQEGALWYIQWQVKQSSKPRPRVGEHYVHKRKKTWCCVPLGFSLRGL